MTRDGKLILATVMCLYKDTCSICPLSKTEGCMKQVQAYNLHLLLEDAFRAVPTIIERTMAGGTADGKRVRCVNRTIEGDADDAKDEDDG